MAEHEQHKAPFDEQAVAEALSTQSATIRDVAYGEGVQYCAGRGTTRLEIFPRTGVTRLTAPGVRIELFDSAALDVSDGGLEFSRTQPGQDASLTVVAGGGIVFTLVAGGERTATATPEPTDPLPPPLPPTSAPVGTPETAQEARSDAVDTSVPPPPLRATDAPQEAREAAPPSPADEQAASQQQAATETEQGKIQLTGRLGRDPQFRTTKTGLLVGRFPLAVHREDGHTTWHTVLAFGSRAEQLQRRVDAGELTQGREVDIIGYPHVNEWTGKDGKTRTTQQIHAVAVKKR